MPINFNTSVNQVNPQFKARFSQKDIKILMDSAEQVYSGEQDLMIRLI